MKYHLLPKRVIAITSFKLPVSENSVYMYVDCVRKTTYLLIHWALTKETVFF